MSNFLLIKYRHGINHGDESVEHGVVGIPAGSHISGSKAFQETSPHNKLYGAIYDVNQRAIVSLFTSLGNPYFTDERGTFRPDTRVPGENWGRRINVMIHKTNRIVPRNQFIEWGGTITKGSANYMTEVMWNRLRDHMTA